MPSSLLDDAQPAPRGRGERLAWLATRESEVAALCRAAMRRIIGNALTSWERTLTADAGDLASLASIPAEWDAFMENDLASALSSVHLSAVVSAVEQMPTVMSAEALDRWTAVVNEAAVSYMSGATNRLAAVGQQVWRDVRSQTVTAIEKGLSTEALKSRLEGITRWSEYRADTVARTEVVGAFVQGEHAAQLALGDDGPIEKVWVAALDDRTRESHADTHDQCVPMSEKFNVGGYAMDAPHDPSAPAGEVVNCFPEGERVEWVGELLAIARRWYEGDLCEIVTIDGDHFTVTPNHPILTSVGWQPAHAIQFGDEVLRAVSAPQIDNMPPRVEQVYRAASEYGTQMRRGGSRVDFHGDGTDHEIEIVRPDRDLFAIADVESLKFSRKLSLSDADGRTGAFLDDGGAVRSLLGSRRTRRDAAILSSRLVRWRSEPTTFVVAETRQPQSVGLAAGSHSQTLSPHPADERVTTDPGISGDDEHTQTLCVHLTKVIRVRRFPSACHVYSLESSSGILVTGNVVSHNCRCVVEYLYAGDTRPDGSTVEGSVSNSSSDDGYPPDPVIEQGLDPERHSLAAHLREDGTLTPERQALHDQIVADALAGHAPQPDPEMMFMGGGGGAGKSTVLNSGLLQAPADAVTINADDLKMLLPEATRMIAEGDPMWAQFVHEESSYLAKRVRVEALRGGLNVTMDAVGSNAARVAEQVAEARALGYSTRAVYVSIEPETGVARALKRFEDAVAAGKPGRFIPEDVVRAAHLDANAAWQRVVHSVDHAVLIDNETTPFLIAEANAGQVTVANADAWRQYLTRCAV